MPDQVKAVLTSTANPLTDNLEVCQGAGAINAAGASAFRAPRKYTQTHTPSTGTGTLEASRGTDHLENNGVVLEGEQDIMGNPWNGYYQNVTVCEKVGKGKNAETICTDDLAAVDTLWNEGEWNGTSWSGTSWSGTSWSGLSWSGTSWSGTSWSGLS